VSYQFAAQFSFPPENLLTLLSPTVLGTSMTYWGRWYPWEMSIFVGISALVLAAIAAVDGTPARRRFAFTMTGVLVVLALGAYTPVFDALYAWLPGFNRFRGTTKFMIFATLFLAMAAAHGADALVERRRISNAVIGGSTAVGAVLGLAALLVVNAGGQAWWRDMLAAVRNTGQILHTPASSYENAGFLAAAAYDTSFALLIAAVTCFAVVALLLWGRRNRVATWALIVLAVGELVVFSRGTIATTEPQRREATGIKDIVDTYAGDYRVLNLVGSNAAMAAGALDVWGYDPNVVARYAQLLAATQGVHPDDAGQYLSIERDHPVLDLLRCRFIFSVRDRRLSVRERPSHLPHALLVSRYRVLTSRDDVIAAVTDASFDPRREVILEEPPDPAPVEASRPGDVRITTVSSDELLVDANLQSPAILLITDTYARGWRVRAEPGSAQPTYRILPANHALRAIPLAAGQHQLRLEYLPSGFVAGRWVSIVAVVIFAGLTAVVVLRRRSGVKPGA
jgi:hypothetical protein